MRALTQDAMDVMGGAAIYLGPRNLIARARPSASWYSRSPNVSGEIFALVRLRDMVG